MLAPFRSWRHVYLPYITGPDIEVIHPRTSNHVWGTDVLAPFRFWRHVYLPYITGSDIEVIHPRISNHTNHVVIGIVIALLTFVVFCNVTYYMNYVLLCVYFPYITGFDIEVIHPRISNHANHLVISAVVAQLTSVSVP